MYERWKRRMDVVLCGGALVVLGWLFLLICLAIRLESKGPLFFKQKRIGKNKKYFYILKFRTMRTDTPKDTPTHLLQNPDHYITKVGKWLRKTSLDELPQLLNVLRGDMSVVGPRPALWNQYDLIALRDENHANALLPGITGLAQIRGRDELPIQVKADFDGEYYRNRSLLLDLKIIGATFRSVAAADGVREGGVREHSHNRKK